MKIPLNPSQQKAVEYTDGHLLVIAGPGTGKTHTIIHRIAHISKTLGEKQKILAITFTNKAAGEMHERLQKLVAGTNRQVTVGTFHQFCLQILSEYVHAAELPENFVVASPEDIDLLSKDLWPEMTKRERSLCLEEISQWKATRFDCPLPTHADDYNKKMSLNGWIDFDDLILKTVCLLRNNVDILRKVQNEYPYVFVDEYQDINRIQHDLLKLLVGGDGVITAIGDPNQAIYGFRGSNIKYFKQFEHGFKNAKVLSLSENYRCAQNILSASTQVMSAVTHSMHVPEITAKIYTDGCLTIHEAKTDKAEAEYVVHQIEKMVGGMSMFSQDSGRVKSEEDGVHSFDDIAVLYRLKSQRFALKTAFDRMGIPYEISGETKDADETLVDDVYFPGHEEASIEAEKVSLMTLHAAKGLEFPVVFIVGCEEKILPLQLKGLISDPEEERRLFYVGMTRAKERLYLVRAASRPLYGKRYTNGPSPFLSDIEEKLKEYEKVNIKSKRNKREDTQMSLF